MRNTLAHSLNSNRIPNDFKSNRIEYVFDAIACLLLPFPTSIDNLNPEYMHHINGKRERERNELIAVIAVELLARAKKNHVGCVI